MEGHLSDGPPPLPLSVFPALPTSRLPSISSPPGLLPLPASALPASALPESVLPIRNSPAVSAGDCSAAIADSSLNAPSLWKDLFTRASTVPKNFPPPSFTSDGVPVVKAPPTVLLKSSETWKDYVVCHFFGDPPPLKKIYADLNPIWGKKGSIQIRHYSHRACLILIPNPSTRKWVLDIGFWSAGTVAFAVSLWTPSSSLTEQTLSSAPVWLTLRDVPPQLWSPEGFAIVASGVGDPLPPANSAALPSIGVASPRIRAVVPLNNGPLPSSVIVEDDEGSQVTIGIQYDTLPPLCPTCSHYGHRKHRCPLRSRTSSSFSPSTASLAPPNATLSSDGAVRTAAATPSLGFEKLGNGPDKIKPNLSIAHSRPTSPLLTLTPESPPAGPEPSSPPRPIPSLKSVCTNTPQTGLLDQKLAQSPHSPSPAPSESPTTSSNPSSSSSTAISSSPHRLPSTPPTASSFTSLLFKQFEGIHPPLTMAGNEELSTEDLEEGEVSCDTTPIHCQPSDSLHANGSTEATIPSQELSKSQKKKMKKKKKSNKGKPNESAKQHLPPFFPISKRLI